MRLNRFFKTMGPLAALVAMGALAGCDKVNFNIGEEGVPLADLDLDSLGTGAGDRRHRVHRKLALGENGEHLATHVPRRTDNCYPITHLTNPRSNPE